MGAAHFPLFRLKNTAANFVRPFSSSAAALRRWRHHCEASEESDSESAAYKHALKLQRPTTIPYKRSFRNSVNLIGEIELPMKAVNPSKFGFYTYLKVKASTGVYRDFRIMLKFWEEMAEVSVQHLKPNDLVYVLGRVGSYMKFVEDGKPILRYEVIVTEINFVSERRPITACQKPFQLEQKASAKDIMQRRRNRLHLWQVFFSNPYEWWDNRESKLNPRMPDFKHKDTGEALWLKDSDPLWVNRQLQLLDSRSSKRSPGQGRSAWSSLSPLVYDDDRRT